MYHMKMITTLSYEYPRIGDRMKIVGFDSEFVRGASISPGIAPIMKESVGQVLKVKYLFQCKTKVELSDGYIYNMAWLEPYTVSELNRALMLL